MDMLLLYRCLITSAQGLLAVDKLCKSENGFKQRCVVSLPTITKIRKESETQLKKLQAQGVTIVARARREPGPRSKFPKGAILVAPPGITGKFQSTLAPDLWVHTSPNDWVDAVLRTTGVAAEYSCDPSKYPVKASVLELGQKRSSTSRKNFLVLEPLVETQSNSLKPSPWVIKAPSNPWIDSLPPESYQDFTDGNVAGNEAPRPYPPEPRPRLPGINDIFPIEMWNPGSKRVHEDAEEYSRRTKKIS
ncbi:hypothetical protein H0H93_001772 [Arthromyces matolae]|nr:hypothetical protein H0H93_001772 [Arthromyces matolae]